MLRRHSGEQACDSKGGLWCHQQSEDSGQALLRWFDSWGLQEVSKEAKQKVMKSLMMDSTSASLPDNSEAESSGRDDPVDAKTSDSVGTVSVYPSPPVGLQ